MHRRLDYSSPSALMLPLTVRASTPRADGGLGSVLVDKLQHAELNLFGKRFEQSGDTHFGEGAVLFGKGDRRISLKEPGSEPRPTAQHPGGGRFTTEMICMS